MKNQEYEDKKISYMWLVLACLCFAMIGLTLYHVGLKEGKTEGKQEGYRTAQVDFKKAIRTHADIELDGQTVAAVFHKVR